MFIDGYTASCPMSNTLQERLTAKEAMAHPYFDPVRKQPVQTSAEE